MSRKFLGIDQERTIKWVSRVNTCLVCKARSREALLSDPIKAFDGWFALRDHIWNDHSDEELCVSCFKWFEDSEFSDHLDIVHHAVWKDVSVNEVL